MRVFLVHVRDPQFYAIPSRTRARNGRLRVMGFPPIGIMSLMQVGQPALAVVWSAIFLSQSIRGLQVVGMVMVVFGLATVVVQTQRRTAKVLATENGELAGSAG